MKKLYFLVLVLFVVGSVRGQDEIINFTDPTFKATLLNIYPAHFMAKNLQGNWTAIDTNNNDEIEVSEALQISYLKIQSPLGNTIGLNYFVNMKDLSLLWTYLNFLDVSALVNLEKFNCSYNSLTTLDLSNLSNLTEITCDYNQLTSLDISSLANITKLSCSNNFLSSMDISSATNLELFNGTTNQFTSFDFSGFTSLQDLSLIANNLQNIHLEGCTNLEYLTLHNNPLQTLDVSSCSSLYMLGCGNTNILSLDVSGLSELIQVEATYGVLESINFEGCDALTNLWLQNNNLYHTLDISNLLELDQLNVTNNYLDFLILKKGTYTAVSFYNNPGLQYICVDEQSVASYQGLVNNANPPFYNDVVVNSYCSFTPGGIFYTIKGSHTIDVNNNGCDLEDVTLGNLKFSITNGSQTGNIISDQSGAYLIPVQIGTHTIVPILENPTFFNVSPPTISVAFPATTSPFTQNFCITPNGQHPDLEVAILPTTPARPGFDADYTILIKNKGNIQQSGTVSLMYNDTVLDYVIAEPLFTTQAEGALSWAFANLQPFETREINVTLNVNSPMETPAVNGDDVLTYTANITSDQIDELPLDNTFTLPQIVVNSFDPNDKTCLEGTSITPDMIGKYVHYMIRFENTGTFAAENIVVKDMIDTGKFDVSSLVALNGSHPYVTRITGNKVEFIFEGINLPFDDANNDGYVVFKIKTLPTLALDDSFSNTASIYFDFNHPIVTEPAVTTFAVLKTKDFEFNDYFTLYPNPTSGILNITSKQAIELQSISIYNVLGQMVVSVPNAKGISNVDVSNLSTGNYFIKIVSDKGTSNAKFIKQ